MLQVNILHYDMQFEWLACVACLAKQEKTGKREWLDLARISRTSA